MNKNLSKKHKYIWVLCCLHCVYFFCILLFDLIRPCSKKIKNIDSIGITKKNEQQFKIRKYDNIIKIKIKEQEDVRIGTS